jgi:hypothetical protein
MSKPVAIPFVIKTFSPDFLKHAVLPKVMGKSGKGEIRF